MEKILVLRGGALGDFLVTLPALAALRARWPAARLELAGNAPAAALAVARGLLGAAHSQQEPRWSALYAAAPLPADFAAWLAGFDLVLSFWPDPDADLARRFPLRPGQRFLSFPAHPPAAPAAPAALHYAAPLRALGLPPVSPHHRLAPLSVSHSPPLSFSPSSVVVHPGSGSQRKNWPAHRWHALLAHLDRTLPPGAPIVLLLGEAEEARWSGPSVAAALPPRVAIFRQRPLEDLVTLLSAARLFLGHDSGPGHLAAACGTPCLLLFGPTDPAVWAPSGEHVRTLRAGPSLADLSVAAVIAALPLL